MEVEQVLGAFIKKMSKNLDTSKRVYITHPEFRSEMGRETLRNACIIAGIRDPYLLPESTATVTSHAYDQI